MPIQHVNRAVNFKLCHVKRLHKSSWRCRREFHSTSGRRRCQAMRLSEHILPIGRCGRGNSAYHHCTARRYCSHCTVAWVQDAIGDTQDVCRSKIIFTEKREFTALQTSHNCAAMQIYLRKSKTLCWNFLFRISWWNSPQLNSAAWQDIQFSDALFWSLHRECEQIAKRTFRQSALTFRKSTSKANRRIYVSFSTRTTNFLFKFVVRRKMSIRQRNNGDLRKFTLNKTATFYGDWVRTVDAVYI